MNTKIKLTSILLAVGISTAALAKPSFFASTERFGYTGTISVYNTLQDAKHQRNARITNIIVPQRDCALYDVFNAPTFDVNFNEFLTDWYSSMDGMQDGIGNPNNTDFGFVQMADGANGLPTTWTQKTGFYHQDLQRYTVRIRGANATYAGTFARLWNAGSPDIGGEGTRGTFISYDYRLTAYGLNATQSAQHFFRNTTNAANYSGTFQAIFQNQSVNSPASNGYYVVNLSFNNVSWAAANGFALDDAFGSKKIHGGDEDGGSDFDGDDGDDGHGDGRGN